MIVLLEAEAGAAAVDRVIALVTTMGGSAHPLAGHGRPAVGVLGDGDRIDVSALRALPDVAQIVHLATPYKQVSLAWHPARRIVRLGGGSTGPGVTIGGREIVVMAGPCSVESESQILGAAIAVRQAGATILRAGAFKPRSSPYAFQGLGRDGLRLLARARAETGLLIVTEAVDAESVEQVAEVADVVQIGARNMQNYSLLRRAGRAGRPVLLKRAPSATVQELLLSAEYIVAEGNPDVLLCERGVRGFDGATRNLFDVGAIPLLRSLSHLPVVADPSHGTGVRELVRPMARAAVAAGADGLMIEVHPDPDRSVSDGAQTLSPQQFELAMHDLRLVAEAVGRRVAEPAGVQA